MCASRAKQGIVPETSRLCLLYFGFIISKIEIILQCNINPLWTDGLKYNKCKKASLLKKIAKFLLIKKYNLLNRKPFLIQIEIKKKFLNCVI